MDKCIRSNDRALVYTNAASSRQEGSLTGLWRSYYARSIALWRCDAVHFAGKICRISLPQSNVFVDKCIRSNDRVLVYTNAACSRQEGSPTGLWRSYYARTIALRRCNTVHIRVRYGAYLCPRVLYMWINVFGVTIGHLSTQSPPLVGRKEA